jgi:pyruvate kinase
MKKVRIYGTLGPACADRETLVNMFREGMDGMRLNLSHAMLKDSAALIETYHAAAGIAGVRPELLIDMQGPELRIGALSEPVRLIEGERIDVGAIPFPDAILSALTDGAEVLLDDGKILLKAEESSLLTVRGGLLESRKSVALPGLSVSSPTLTEADRINLLAAKSYGVTGVMQPFVRGREDLWEVRRAMDAAGLTDLRLFAKVENRAGMETLSELLPHCDEIVIARGDLGNAMPLWQLPAAQKNIAAACRAFGRDFTVVTQMLDSMTRRPVPTRAEVSDIFNAVLDGASSVMLTGETATGDYPVPAIRTLVKTVRSAEAYRDGEPFHS